MAAWFRANHALFEETGTVIVPVHGAAASLRWGASAFPSPGMLAGTCHGSFLVTLRVVLVQPGFWVLPLWRSSLTALQSLPFSPSHVASQGNERHGLAGGGHPSGPRVLSNLEPPRAARTLWGSPGSARLGDLGHGDGRAQQVPLWAPLSPGPPGPRHGAAGPVSCRVASEARRAGRKGARGLLAGPLLQQHVRLPRPEEQGCVGCHRGTRDVARPCPRSGTLSMGRPTRGPPQSS